MSESLSNGLETQIETFKSHHPDTKLIVIDTLQMVRNEKDCGYGADYKELSILKALADKLAITILLVHHTRKCYDSDPFNMISGSTGISGCVDGSMVLLESKRGSREATLYCVGRDIENQEYRVLFNEHRWTPCDEIAPTPPDIFSFAIHDFMMEQQSFIGSATDLCELLYQKFKEKLQVCKDLMHGFDINGFADGTPLQRGKLISSGVNFILGGKPQGEDKPLKELFAKEALLLRQAHSLCSSMTTEQERHEAAYFEAVRAMIMKITMGGQGDKPLSLKEINEQINNLLKASIQSEGVINLFDSKTVGENFSLFDPQVLEEISKMKEKNIAVEILKKLMAEQISVYKRTNVVKSEKFSEKITMLMNSYYNGLITNEEVIKELLEAAEEIANLHKEGKKLGLSEEELAFYDALTKPQAIKDFYSNEDLLAMTRELTEMLRKNRTIDWQQKETVRAGMRKMVKRLLRKYKYPPEEYENAIDTVISQCEMWTDHM